ncbi:MAG: respiratory chain complex I subunit 1 family protein [Gammaproteobacteria bacterium]
MGEAGGIALNLELILLQFLVFPGLLFTGVAGLVTTWVDRKMTARVQMRQGPPLLQPFYDIGKLMIKETCVPREGSIALFLVAPLIGLAGVVLTSTILWRALLDPQSTFVGDLIVLLYLLTLPAFATILGASASHNPLASLGGSREMKLMLAYELPFVLAVLVPVIQVESIRLGDILAAPAVAALPSGVIAFGVAVACMQAKLTLVPFDMPEAETELSGGAYIEYSGPPLAMFKLTRAMMLFTLPVFLVVVFVGGAVVAGGWAGMLLGLLIWAVQVIVIVVLHNTEPRMRTDQAVRWFWGPVTGVALIAAALAWIGW